MNQINRIPLAQLPTPIQFLKKTSAQVGRQIYIWRDDLNGCIESGNKIRKLEFLLADALQKNCDWIVTCGGPQSNHTRATAISARKMGLGISILTVPGEGFDRNKTPTGNLLINHIFQAEMTWIERAEFLNSGSTYLPFLQKEAERLKALGKRPYVIPLGGSNSIGLNGYRFAVPEMLKAWKNLGVGVAPDDLFCALGSGGTFVGIALGLQEQKTATRLHGVNVIGPLETAKKYVHQLTQDYQAERNVQIGIQPEQLIDGYVGGGYSIASDEELRFYSTVACDEGILLDPCYTGKAFRGMISEIQKNPNRFGKHILFLHSGGVFGTFAYAEQYQKIRSD